MVKSGCGQSGHGTQKWTDGIKSFFHADTNSGKVKVNSTIFGWAWSKMAIACMRPQYLFYLKNEFMNWADFFNADSDAIIFG